MVQPHVIMNQPGNAGNAELSRFCCSACLQCSDERIRARKRSKSKLMKARLSDLCRLPLLAQVHPAHQDITSLSSYPDARVGDLVHSNESSLSISVHVPSPVLWPSCFILFLSRAPGLGSALAISLPPRIRNEVLSRLDSQNSQISLPFSSFNLEQPPLKPR